MSFSLESPFKFLMFLNRRDLTYTSAIVKQILKPKQWNYIGASYDYDSEEASLWHEGNKVASKMIGRTEIATQFKVRLGALNVGGLRKYYKGRVACLQFYPEALTSKLIEKARIACKPCKSALNRPEVRKQWIYAMDLDFHRVPCGNVYSNLFSLYHLEHLKVTE